MISPNSRFKAFGDQSCPKVTRRSLAVILCKDGRVRVPYDEDSSMKRVNIPLSAINPILFSPKSKLIKLIAQIEILRASRDSEDIGSARSFPLEISLESVVSSE